MPAIELARQAHEAGLIETARELYLDLGTRSAKVGLSILYREEGDFASSLTCCYDTGEPYELADTLFSLERYMDAAGIYAALADDDPDPLVLYMLAASLRNAGTRGTEVLFRDVAARAAPWDAALLRYTYLAIAEEVEASGDHDQAARLFAQLEEYP